MIVPRLQLDWIDSQRERMIDLVTTWSHINSGSYNLPGLQCCADAVGSEFSRLGGQMTRLDLPPQEIIDAKGHIVFQPLGQAIQILKRPNAPIRVLLAIHYDTVYGEGHSFQRTTRVDANTLRGPGVADAKGGLVVLLTALEAIERSGAADQLGWEVLLNPDEEVGSPGSSSLFTEAAERNHLGLVFEPALADGSLVGARKGSGNFTAVVTGRAAHAGRDPQHGRNAIHELAELIGTLNVIGEAIPSLTVNVGHIEGGGPVNIVPDLAIARFNLRVDSAKEQSKVEGLLRQAAVEINSREGLSLKIHGGFTAPPKPLDGPTLQWFEQVALCGRELGLSLSWRSSGGVCDGNRLAAAGLPTVDTLGPRGGGLHSDAEYLLLDSLTERAKLTALLLLKLPGSFPLSPVLRGEG